MKTPIEVKDIRRGDLIRAEVAGSEVAIERRAMYDGDKGNLLDSAYYLLDRPTPPVELPTEPTLGWLTNVTSGPTLAIWATDNCRPGYARTCVSEDSDGRVDTMSAATKYITAFTPAVAVPKAALDELRATWVRARAKDLGPFIATFLAAVDAANGDA